MSNTAVAASQSGAVGKTKVPAGRKKQVLIGAGALAVVGSLYFGHEMYFFVSTDNAQVRANTFMLAPKVTGFIAKVNAEENAHVKAGTVLAEIDNRDYQARSSGAENEMGSLRARAADAKRTFDRLDQLWRAGAVSQQQRDTAEAAASETAKKLKAMESQYNLSQLTLSDTQVRAPSDGVIAKKNAEMGMLASPGVPLFGFVSDDGRWVIANFKETDLGRIKAGQHAEVKVDALSGRHFDGIVESVSPATGATFTLLPPDNATGNFTKVVQRVPVRIHLEGLTPEDINVLRAGLSAEVKIRVR